MTSADDLVSPIPRRISRPRWLDTRLVLGAVLVLSSVVVGARVVAAADQRVTVLALRTALSAGTTLTAAALVSVRVAMSAPDRARYAATADELAGRQLVRDVGAGELVPLSAVRPVASSTTLVVPLARGAAPSVSAGERITIWLTAPGCGTRVLLADVVVQSARHNDAGSFDDVGGQSVVVSVDPATAKVVVAALALDDVILRAGRVDGAPSTAQPDDAAACATPSA